MYTINGFKFSTSEQASAFFVMCQIAGKEFMAEQAALAMLALRAQGK
jgi:hypothetical protein